MQINGKISCIHGLESNIFKMSIPLKAMYEVDTIPIKIAIAYFRQVGKKLLKFI